MSDKIYIKRSVKEKLPRKKGFYAFCGINGYNRTYYFNPKVLADRQWAKSLWKYWLEEVTLEEYLKEIGLTVLKPNNPMTKEEIIDSLKSFGAEQQTENTWYVNGHYFFIKKLEDGSGYDLIEL